MKKALLVAALFCFGQLVQAQIRFGFTNPDTYDNWNVNDPRAGVELVVWTPNNDTLTFQVGADVTAIDGSARNGFEFNFPPVKWIFEPGTNIYDSSNKKVIKYNFTPNTTLFGEREFFIKLTNIIGVTTAELMYSKDLMRVIIDYDGTNVGVKKLSSHSYRLFPIPAQSSLFVEGANPETFTVYDLSGRVAQSGSVNNQRIDVSELTPGLYVLHAQTANGLIVQKFLKD